MSRAYRPPRFEYTLYLFTYWVGVATVALVILTRLTRWHFEPLRQLFSDHWVGLSVVIVCGIATAATSVLLRRRMLKPLTAPECFFLPFEVTLIEVPHPSALVRGISRVAAVLGVQPQLIVNPSGASVRWLHLRQDLTAESLRETSPDASGIWLNIEGTVVQLKTTGKARAPKDVFYYELFDSWRQESLTFNQRLADTLRRSSYAAPSTQLSAALS